MRQHDRMEFPEINGFGHIDLTVTDVERSVRWWEDVLGFKLINTRETPDFKLWSVIHPVRVLHRVMSHSNPASDRFDECAVGLDHLALRVPDRARSKRGRSTSMTAASHTRVCWKNWRAQSIVFRDPDNIQLELWAFDADLVRTGLNATPMSEAPPSPAQRR